MSHESSQIPLDAGMWLDELSPPSSALTLASTRHSTSSLEDSLQLLHRHTGATHTALAFSDADDDVHALFPMLSESSFDYEDDAKSQHDHNADSAAAFPDDLSPIMTPRLVPKTRSSPRAAPRSEESIPNATPNTPTAILQPRRKVTAPATTAKDTMVATTVGVAIPFPDQDLAPIKALATPTPPANRPRRRRLRSTTLTAALTHWTAHEQNMFFLVFKPKWSIASPSPEQFATLLLERFDAVSDKLRSTHKTSHDAEAFYTTMLHAIIDLLETVAPHDIDLLNPDEIRIALWCWHKLLADSLKRADLEQMEDATEEQKKPLAQELCQSIVRSRRQMRKAKSTRQTAAAVAEESLALPAGLDAVEEMESLEGLLREALEHSSLPSYLYQLAPVEANTVPVVHHPIVRKKNRKQPVSAVATAGQKRPRSESVELYHAFTNGTPLPSLSSQETRSRPSFVTPPVGHPSKKAKHERLNQTPQQSSGKKIYIKLRMVPRDTQTKEMVERCGCNPKVELKLSSTKKVSDVLDHMTKKWAKVQALVDEHTTLHFFQKDSAVASPEVTALTTQTNVDETMMKSWSHRNHDVTCLDIWKQSGKVKNDEYIAVVSYMWCVEDAVDTTGSLGPWVDGDPAQLLDLLDRGMAHTQKHLAFDQDECSSKDNSPLASPLNLNDPSTLSDREHKAASVLPLEKKQQSLQAFSETIAFDTKSATEAEAGNTEEQLSLASLPEDALSELMELSPNSQRMRRRRITPVLVSTSEWQI